MGAVRDDPFLWAALAALFLGLAAGQAFRAPLARGGAARRRKAASRWTRSFAFAAFAVLSATALLVLPAKSSLLEPSLPWTGAAAFALGFLAGLWPLAAGLPAALLVSGALLLARASLAGWVPFRGAGPVASLLPFERSGEGAGPFAYRAELELAERDSIPVAQELLIESDAAGLAVEGIVLRGPVALAAKLARGASRFYRVAAVAGRAGPGPSFAARPWILDGIAALDPAEGWEPGAPAAERASPGDLLVRRRSTSVLAPLLVLEPLRFDLDASMDPRIAAERY